MKRLFLYLSLLFLLTCAKDSTEDNSSVYVPPPSNTTNPTPTVTQYTLTVTAGEGGSVSTAGGTYNSGTSTSITATPNEGYVFESWSDGNTDLTRTVSISENITLNAIFYRYLINYNDIIEVRKSNLAFDINSEKEFQDVRALFSHMGMAGSFVYSSGNVVYYLAPGIVSGYLGNLGSLNSALDIEPSSTYLLKKDEYGWSIHKKFENVKTWVIRNYDRFEDYIVLGDGNEIGTSWKGDLWVGKILGDDIDWEKLTNEDTMSWFHDVAIGDLDNDGLIDIGGGPGIDTDVETGAKDYILYSQNNQGDFNLRPQNSLIEYSESRNEMSSFSIDFNDLDNDGFDEIIVCSKYISILKLDDTSGKFHVIWSKSYEDLYPEYGIDESFWGTSIKVDDLNNDGIKDISIAREGVNSLNFTSFETWIGNGDLTFEPKFVKSYSGDVFLFREFEHLDVNNDSFKDIVLKTNGTIGGYKSSEYQVDVNNIRSGIKIDELIWINDGSGSFYKYFQDDYNIDGIYPRKLIPYMENGNLHFVGSIENEVQNNPNSKVNIEFFDIKIQID